jgi:holliday junction DNA helicase RuvB
MPPDSLTAPESLSHFIGQDRVKARLELAIAAARSRGEPLGNVLLLGSPGLGKATLARLIARTLGVALKYNNASALATAGDLAGVLTNLEDKEVLLLEDVHQLKRTFVEYLLPAATAYKLNVDIDTGPNARQVYLNLPPFTLIGTAPRQDRVPRALLSCFSIVETLDSYTNADLAAIATRFAADLQLVLAPEAAARVANSSDGTPLDILNRLRHIRDYAHLRTPSDLITAGTVTEALKLLSSAQFEKDSSNGRPPIPSEVRREVWRRDQGKCVTCGSRENLEYDHIIPLARGGSNTARNIELLCEACNRSKSDSIQ